MSVRGLLIMIALILVSLGSLYFYSGKFHRQVANLTGYSDYCIGGVEYIQFVSGATVKYKPDGTISTCK